MRFLADHLLLDPMLDKYAHAFHYCSPAVQSASTTGATHVTCDMLATAIVL